MKDEATETEAFRVEEGGVDLRERTKAFALRVVKMFVALPKTDEARVLGKQVLRSGTSVEGHAEDQAPRPIPWASRSRAHLWIFSENRPKLTVDGYQRFTEVQNHEMQFRLMAFMPPAQVSTSASQGIPVFEIGPALYEAEP